MSNQYTYSVPFAEEQLRYDYINLRMSQVEIARKWTTSQKVIWRALHKMGIPTRKAMKRNQWGKYNSSWKGGRVLLGKKKRQRGERASFGNGYYYILDHSHPNAKKAGYVAEHIVVATKERGRPLAANEVVHHIDLNKHNNSPNNLAISLRKPHAIWHVQLEEIAVQLMKQGHVVFTPETGYRLTK